jgi:hypothetical protein
MSLYRRVRLSQVRTYRSRPFPRLRPIPLRHVLRASHLRERLSAPIATKLLDWSFYSQA